MIVLAVLLAESALTAVAFAPSPFLSPSSSFTSTRLHLFGNKEEDERIISGLMKTKNMSRTEAEEDYKKFKSNPNVSRFPD